MKSILDPAFRYTSSANTDLRKTFARVRREQGKAPTSPTLVEPPPIPNVVSVFRHRGRA